MKPGKTRRKVIEGNADTIIRQTTVKNLPRTASVVGGTRRKRRYDKTNHRQKPPTYRQSGGRYETNKGELKENADAMTRETNVETLLQATIVAGGRDERMKTNTEWKSSKTHSPARWGSA